MRETFAVHADIRIASVQVGMPKQMGTPGADAFMERAWTSGIFKHSVAGPVRLGRTGFQGDGQADLEHHGGEDKAVLAYAAGHYPLWRKELPDLGLQEGAFGENLTVEGASETGVAIGDVWQTGAVRLQVSQPRSPCWKLARRHGVEDMVSRVLSSGRTGWYLRVLTEGELAAGQVFTLVARPHPEWTVARATAVRLGVRERSAEAGVLAALPELSRSWKRALGGG